MARRAALLLPNRAEAAVLAGTDDPEAAARALIAYAREVVVKLGRGRRAVDGRRGGRARARGARGAADSTGAGDAFAAGLLAARRRGDAPVAALAAGCALAAEAVARPGAR